MSFREKTNKYLHRSAAIEQIKMGNEMLNTIDFFPAVPHMLTTAYIPRQHYTDYRCRVRCFWGGSLESRFMFMCFRCYYYSYVHKTVWKSLTVTFCAGQCILDSNLVSVLCIVAGLKSGNNLILVATQQFFSAWYNINQGYQYAGSKNGRDWTCKGSQNNTFRKARRKRLKEEIERVHRRNQNGIPEDRRFKTDSLMWCSKYL